MPVSREFQRHNVADIVIDRESRQRRTISGIEELADSIKRAGGLLHPIVVTRELKLVAGERRLAAHQLLGWPQIDTHYYDQLSSEELQVVELEENIKRSQMDWQDSTLAYRSIHNILTHSALEAGESWSKERTAERIGIHVNWLRKVLHVADKLASGEIKILNAGGLNQAMNIIERETTRRADNELNTLVAVLAGHEPEGGAPGLTSLSPGGDGEQVDAEGGTGQTTLPATPVAPLPSKPPVEECLIQANFHEWARNYSGRPFNLLHCDFPYGINHGESDQGGAAEWGAYDDSAEVYWTLLDTLQEYHEKLLFPSAHLMFWLSMEYYEETKDFIRKYTDFEVQNIPLIWFKTDGKGIVSDVNRRPRHVYETALIASRGDRRILTPIADAYGAPTSKSQGIHISEKPVPVLRHFFRLFVDEYTELLDPTAGSGTAIRAAESMGARRSLGLELSPEYVEAARHQLRAQRNLDRLSRMAGPPRGVTVVPLDDPAVLHDAIAAAVGEPANFEGEDK